MGKGTRNRQDRTVDKVNNPVKYTTTKRNRSSSSNSLWVKLGVGALAFVMVAILVVNIVVSTGIIMRMSTAISTENFKISGTQMTYFYNQYYRTAQSYATQLGIDTSKDLRDQNFKDSWESYYYPDFFGQTYPLSTYIQSIFGEEEAIDISWYDYLMGKAKEEASLVLVLCEAAKAANVTLDEKDYAVINYQMDLLDGTAKGYYYASTGGYIKAMYGSGINASDIRGAMELVQLANKFKESKLDEFKELVTDEDINKYFDENKEKFLYTSVLSYSFSHSYTPKDVENLTEDEKKAFVEQVEIIRKNDEALKAAKTEAEFYSLVIKINTETKYAELYKALYPETSGTENGTETESSQAESSSSTTTVAKPDYDKLLVYIKNIMLEKYLPEEFRTGDYKIPTDDTTDYKADFDDVEDLIEDVEDFVKEEMDYIYDNDVYKDNEDISKTLKDFLFAEGRVAGDSLVIRSDDETEDDESEEEPKELNELTEYSSTVYLVLEAEHRDEEIGNKIAYLIFDANDSLNSFYTAEKALEELKASAITQENIETLIDKIKDQFDKEYLERLGKWEYDEKNSPAVENYVFNASVWENYLEENWEVYGENYIDENGDYSALDKWVYADGRKSGDSEIITIKDSSDKDLFDVVLVYLSEGEEGWYASVKASVYSDNFDNWTEDMQKQYAPVVNDSVIANVGK